jgi:Protein of unknown function (DUF3224)
MKPKKPFLVCALVCVSLVVAVSLSGTAFASLVPDNHYSASGTWTIAGGPWYGPKIVGENHGKWTEMWTGTEYGTWTGTFQGTSVEPFRGQFFRNGNIWFVSTIYFDGTVLGKGGTAVLRVTIVDDPVTFYAGTWQVVSGTGELRNLHGKGTWMITGGSEAGAETAYTGEVWLR